MKKHTLPWNTSYLMKVLQIVSIFYGALILPSQTLPLSSHAIYYVLGVRVLFHFFLSLSPSVSRPTQINCTLFFAEEREKAFQMQLFPPVLLAFPPSSCPSPSYHFRTSYIGLQVVAGKHTAAVRQRENEIPESAYNTSVKLTLSEVIKG